MELDKPKLEMALSVTNIKQWSGLPSAYRANTSPSLVIIVQLLSCPVPHNSMDCNTPGTLNSIDII